MKKFVTAIIAVMASAILLTGCGSSMKDGTYKAEYKEFDSHGWKDYVTVTVSGGKITAVDYDSTNEAGAIKSTDASYKESMEPVSGTYPEKFCAELEAQMVEKQEIKKVDTIAGATNSSDSFKVLVTELMSKGVSKGSTETVVVG